MDELNDMASFDVLDHKERPPDDYNMMMGRNTPSPPLPDLDEDPILLNSPSGSSFLSDMSINKGQNHSVNGVHMHIQENAKIPLHYQAVDRSNSSNVCLLYTSPSPRD